MANTHALIAGTTVTGSATASISFTSIPQTYTDLKIICKSRINGTGDNLAMRWNDSTGTYAQIVASTTTAGSSPSYTNGLTSIAYWYGGTNDTQYDGPRWVYNEVAIHHYTGSNYKNCRIYGFGPANGNFLALSNTQALWQVTDAITKITIFNYQSSNIAIGSSFQLYGIKRN